MVDAKKDKHAQSVYETICKVLDKKGLKYQNIGKDKDGDWTVRFGGTGEDLPMEFAMFVDTERQLIRMLSPMPFEFSEDKRVDAAIAIARANYKMIDGNFDFDMDSGRTIFKMTSCAINSIISEDLIDYIIGLSISMVDEFNDKFFMLEEGIMSLQDFLEKY